MSRFDVVMLITPSVYHKKTAMMRDVKELEDRIGFFIHFEFMSRYRNDWGFFLRFGMDVEAVFPLRRGRPGTAISGLKVIPVFLCDAMVIGPVPFRLWGGDLMPLVRFLRRPLLLLPPLETGGVAVWLSTVVRLLLSSVAKSAGQEVDL